MITNRGIELYNRRRTHTPPSVISATKRTQSLFFPRRWFLNSCSAFFLSCFSIAHFAPFFYTYQHTQAHTHNILPFLFVPIYKIPTHVEIVLFFFSFLLLLLLPNTRFVVRFSHSKKKKKNNNNCHRRHNIAKQQQKQQQQPNRLHIQMCIRKSSKWRTRPLVMFARESKRKNFQFCYFVNKIVVARLYARQPRTSHGTRTRTSYIIIITIIICHRPYINERQQTILIVTNNKEIIKNRRRVFQWGRYGNINIIIYVRDQKL